MALDPNIALAGRPVQGVDLAQIQGQAATISGLTSEAQIRYQEAQQKIQAAKDEAAARAALIHSQGDYESAAKLLDTTNPTVASLLRQKLVAQREALQKVTTSHLDNYKKAVDLAGQIYNQVQPGDDQSLQHANKAVLALFDDPNEQQQMAGFLPQTATPEELNRIKGIAQTVTDHATQQRLAADEFFSGKQEIGLARSFSQAKTPQDWEAVQKLASAYQAPKALIDSFGQFSPESVKAAADRTLTPDQTATLSGTLPSGEPTQAAKAGQHSAIFKEYQDALASGFKGSFEQYQNIDANRKKSVVNVNSGAPGTVNGLTPEGVDYTATQYRILGPSGIPTRLDNAQKTAVINSAAQQAKALGQSPAQATQKQAAYKADASSLTKMRNMASAAEAFETKALAQAQIIEQLSPQVGRTASPALNALWLSGKMAVTGDSPTSQLYNAISTFSTEYAKIMEGSTGSVAASSDSARQAAKKLIDASMNQKTMTDVLNLMKREMALTLDGYDVTINHITDRMGGGKAPDAGPTVTVERDPKTGALIVKRGGG